MGESKLGINELRMVLIAFLVFSSIHVLLFIGSLKGIGNREGAGANWKKYTLLIITTIIYILYTIIALGLIGLSFQPEAKDFSISYTLNLGQYLLKV